MAVKKGDKVAVDYTGTFEDGTVFDSSQHGDHSHPLEFFAGTGQVIKGFDNALLGMNLGEEKKIIIPPEEGYGQVDNMKMLELPNTDLPPEAQPGMVLLIGTPDGQKIPAKIANITPEKVTIDLNHPLAGKTLYFQIKLISIGGEERPKIQY